MNGCSKYGPCLVLGVGVLFSLCAVASGFQDEPASTPVASKPDSAKSWKDLNLKFDGAQMVRARYRLNDDLLLLQLPMPGDPRPTDTTSAETIGLRQMTLRRADQKPSSSLSGTWQVFQATLEGKEAVQFHGDQLTFSGGTIEVHEHRSDLRYGGEFTCPDDAGRPADRNMTAAEQLEEQFGATLEKNTDGEVTGVSLLGRRGTSSISKFTQEHASTLGKFPKLKTLVIADFEFLNPANDLKFLKTLTDLKKLDLRKTNITDSAMQNLEPLTGLEVLKLEYSFDLTDAAGDVICKLTKLKELDLAYVPVSDEFVAHLQSLESLERLYLYGTKLTDAGLSKLPKFSRLQVLFVGTDDGAQITNASVPKLTEYASLSTLGVPGTRLTLEGTQQLKRQLPGVTIVGKDSLILPKRSPEPGSNGDCSGRVTLNTKAINLTHSFAWESSVDGKHVRHLLLCDEPVDEADLHNSYERYGQDFTFAPFQNQLRLRVADDGSVISIHMVIDGKSFDQAGRTIELKDSPTKDQWKGKVSTSKALTIGSSQIEFDAEFTVRLVSLKPASKAGSKE